MAETLHSSFSASMPCWAYFSATFYSSSSPLFQAVIPQPRKRPLDIRPNLGFNIGVPTRWGTQLNGNKYLLT